MARPSSKIAASSGTSPTCPTAANARLIAAAPDLLEAVQTLVALNDEHAPFGGEIYRDRIDRAWQAARKVIRRATGESSK
jgi:hypothetical protein